MVCLLHRLNQTTFTGLLVLTTCALICTFAFKIITDGVAYLLTIYFFDTKIYTMRLMFLNEHGNKSTCQCIALHMLWLVITTL